MLNKHRILTLSNQVFGAIRHYRQEIPAKYLPQYTWVHGNFPETEENIEAKMVELVKDFDLILIKQIDNPKFVYSLLGACSYLNKPLLVDLDDDVLTTDGLAPEKYAYEEGERKHFFETLLRECTALTISVPALKKYEKYNEVNLFPNGVDMSEWIHTKRTHDRITVGWTGSASHTRDHSLMEEVYAGVVAKHPEVVFSFMGHMQPKLIKGLSRVNWEIKPATTSWDRYPILLPAQGYDIGLAPLIESQFNSSRSLAKWFEYTMTETPVIASEWGAYKDLVDGEEAYLVKTKDGWVDAINHLIENKHDRQRLITNSRKRIENEYSGTALSHTWGAVCEKYIGSGFHS